METLKCPNCGGQISLVNNEMFFCPYCGAKMPKADKTKQEITVNQTNQAVTVIQNPGTTTIVDKFLEHRRALRVLRAEESISRAEEKRLAKEKEKEIEQERRLAAEAEARKEAESARKAMGCALIALSPILIPVGFIILGIIYTLIRSE